MKLYSTPVVGFVCLASLLAMDTRIDCKDVAAAGLLDAIWFSAATATDGTAVDGGAAQTQPGADGAVGATGADGADGTDGTAGATGADGSDGTDGSAGATGATGTDGADGTDGLDGMDGIDLTGTIARAHVSNDGVVDPGSASPGVISATRIATGRYRIVISLDAVNEANKAVADLVFGDFSILLSVEKTNVGGPVGNGSLPELLFAFYENIALDVDARTYEIEVDIRTVTDSFADAGFSFAVFGP